MPIYKYTAIDGYGQKETGFMEAGDESGLEKTLGDKGYYLLEATKTTLAPAYTIDNESSKVKQWLRQLKEYGVDPNEFLNAKTEFYKRHGKELSSNDVVWGLFNKLVGEKAREGDLQDLHGIYYAMALFLNQEGRSHNHVLKIAKKMTLQGYKASGAAKVRISTAGDPCEACKPLNNKLLTIEEALKEMPIPHKGCTFKLYNEKWGWCRCDYAPEL